MTTSGPPHHLNGIDTPHDGHVTLQPPPCAPPPLDMTMM